MDQQVVTEILTSDGDEISEIKSNLPMLEKFIDLARQVDGLPEINKRFYEESRSLYQATVTGLDITDLEKLLARSFGPPVKAAGKPLPRKLRKNSTVKYLGGIQKEQSLFLLQLKTGEFYGALWPWQRNKNKIEIHLGYCSDWITDEDYQQLETLIKRTLSHSSFQKMDTHVGGQIHGISIPSFLQMAEMEQASFCLHVVSGDFKGRLFLQDGVLLDAETDELAGCQAAYRIISMENASIEIYPAEENRADNIHQPLMHVLMESLKIKDEKTSAPEKPPAPPKPKARPAKAPKRLVRLQRAPAPRQPRTKKNRFAVLLGVCLLLVAAVKVGLVFGPQFFSIDAGTDDYQKLITQVEDAGTLENKIVLYENFLQTHNASEHTAAIGATLLELQKQLEDRDFQQTTLQISSFPVDDQYEKKAIALYSSFLEKHPDNRYSKKINDAIAEIKDLIDQYYYEERKRAARLDFSKRLATYRQYLARFPNGRFNQDVEILIQEMGHKYLEYLKSESAGCEQGGRWETCISRIESFIEHYSGTPLEKEALQFKKALSDKRNLADLRRFAEEDGTDYLKIYKSYSDYLARNPDSTQRQIIKEEMARLEKNFSMQRKWLAVRNYAINAGNDILERIRKVTTYLNANKSGPYYGQAQQLLDQLENERLVSMQKRLIKVQKQEELKRLRQEKEQMAQQRRYARQLQSQLEMTLGESTRFKPHGNGVVTDLRTGLIWCVLDSFQELGGCINYDNALAYIQSLDRGGFTDWRLPTSSELASIYKQEPFFPSSGTDWYWTSEAYVKGYHSVVNIVTTKPETVFERNYRTKDQCGAVRAVRP